MLSNLIPPQPCATGQYTPVPWDKPAYLPTTTASILNTKKKACLVLLLNTALTLSLFVLLLFGHLTAAAIAASLVTCFQACVLHISFYLFCFCFSLWHAFNTDYSEHLLFPVDFYEHSFAVFHNAALVWPFIFLVLLLALIDNLAF